MSQPRLVVRHLKKTRIEGLYSFSLRMYDSAGKPVLDSVDWLYSKDSITAPMAKSKVGTKFYHGSVSKEYRPLVISALERALAKVSKTFETCTDLDSESFFKILYSVEEHVIDC